MYKLLIAMLLFVGMAVAAQPGTKALYKVFRLNPESVAITCAHGDLPEITPKMGRVEDGIVIVSCGGGK